MISKSSYGFLVDTNVPRPNIIYTIAGLNRPALIFAPFKSTEREIFIFIYRIGAKRRIQSLTKPFASLRLPLRGE